jgi:hypothetical protein
MASIHGSTIAGAMDPKRIDGVPLDAIIHPYRNRNVRGGEPVQFLSMSSDPVLRKKRI